MIPVVGFSDDLAAKIDAEVRRIMDEQSERATSILSAHREGIERVTAYLLEHEQITGDEFVREFEGRAEGEKPVSEAPDTTEN